MEKENTNKKSLITLGTSSLLLLLGFVYFFNLNFKTIQVQGESMEPTFLNGNRLLASNAYWLVGKIHAGDVVVIGGEEPGEYYIKRVYKLGGEKVDWLNIPQDYSLAEGDYTVPQGMVYVLGDNRDVSEDSRRFGPVESERILGKIVLKRWL
ncbi:MAG: signal peptidase I [Armatimonadetes bacterium]|nr:signal peptidase I [Armatimonadota bacterium]